MLSERADEFVGTSREDGVYFLSLIMANLNMRQIQAAVKHGTRATEILANYATEKPDSYAKAEIYLARALVLMDEYQKASERFERGVSFYEDGRAKDTTIWLMGLVEGSQCLYSINEPASALEMALLAHSIAHKMTGTNSNATDLRFKSAYNAAVLHYKVNEFEQGLIYAEDAYRLSKLSDDFRHPIIALHERALMYGQLGRLVEQAEDLKECIALTDDSRWGTFQRKIFYHSLGLNLYEQGKYEASIYYADQILAESSGPNVMKVLLLGANYIKGKNYLELGRYEMAVASCNEALRHTPRADLLLEEAGLLYPVVDSVRTSGRVKNILEFRSRALIELGRYELALRDHEMIFSLNRITRTRARLEDSQMIFSEGFERHYDLALRTFNTLYQNAEDDDQRAEWAWAALERNDEGTAYSLAAALGNDNLGMSNEERELRHEISQLERRVVRDSSLRGVLAERRLALRDYNQEVSNFMDEPLDREALNALLTERNTELLMYGLTDREGNFLIHLRPGNAPVFVQLDTTTQLGAWVKDWRNAILTGGYRTASLKSPEDQARYDRTFLELGEKLRTYLLPTGIELGENVIIVADGILNFLPFAALPLAYAGGAPLDYGAVEYLGDDHRISYAYSLRVLLAQGRREVQFNNQNVLALAPSFGGRTPVLVLNEIQERGSDRGVPGLSPLAYNLEEVETLDNRLANCRTLTGTRATKDNFLEAARSAGVLHLATHGLADADNRQLSYLAFHQSADTLDVNELLYFNELSTLPLQSELAVLSACETSLGPLQRGEGVMSMASAFTAAGVRSTITTLWAVEDRGMQTLVTRFYDELIEGADRNVALHSASQSLRQQSDYAHPKYWAGVNLHGFTGPLPLQASTSLPIWLYVLMGSGGMVLLFFLLRRRL